MDREAWGPGPWEYEPDEASWVHEGYACKALRHSMGHWCGYVRVPGGHPLHGIEYNEPVPASLLGKVTDAMGGKIGKRGPISVFIAALNGDDEDYRVDVLFDVHGSLTYSAQVEDEFWYGFDCSHCDDYSPGLRAALSSIGGDTTYLDLTTYRPLSYVRAECESLVTQLKELE